MSSQHGGSPTKEAAVEQHYQEEREPYNSFLSFVNPLAYINSSLQRMHSRHTRFNAGGSESENDTISPTAHNSKGTEEKAVFDDEGDDEDDDGGIMMYDFAEVGVPAVPDGGYGWVIVFASFMCNLIVDGIANCFGVFLPKYVEAFHVGKGSAAWAGSLLCGVYLCVGPVVSALTNKFGCRTVCVAGSIVGATGFALSALSSSLEVLIITYGIIGGIGFGLIYLPAVVCVGYYFESKRAFATGIAVCGSGVGTFVFAPIAQMMLSVMSWDQANLIFAGVILLCGGFGMLMKPLAVQVQMEDDKEYEEDPDRIRKSTPRMAEDKRNYFDGGSHSGSAYFMVQLPDGTMERRQKMPLNVDPGVHSSFHLDQLVPGTGPTPTPVPTVPTITEAKTVESVSGGWSSSVVGESNMGTPSSSWKEREALANRTPSKPISVRKSITSTTGAGVNIPRNGSAPQFNYVRSIPKNGSVPVFNQIQRKHSFKAVPLGTVNPANKISKPNLQERRRSSMKNSILSFVSSKPKLNGAPGDDYNSVWSKQELSDGHIFSSSITSQSTAEPRHIVRPMSRKDIFYSGSIVNLPEYQSHRSLHSYRQSVLNLPRSDTQADALDAEVSPVKQAPPYCPCFGSGPGAFKSALAQMMDFSLLKNPVFMFIAISNIFGFLGFYVPFVYIMDSAISKGVDSNKAALLLSIIGVTNTIGRIVTGLLSDLPQINSLFMNNMCILISGICISCVPFCSDYYSYVGVALFFGLFISGFISLTSIILVDLLGLDNLTNAFGLLILFRGAASIVGAPLAGALYDAFQSYQVPFLVAGGFLIISAAISFMVPCVMRFAPPKIILQPPIYQVGYLEDIPEADESSHNNRRGKGYLEDNQEVKGNILIRGGDNITT